MEGVILNKDRQLNNIQGVFKGPTVSISGVGWLVTVLPSSSREERTVIFYMQFPKLNLTNAENVYRTINNVEGATITTGLPVSLGNTSTDGINGVIANSTADFPGFIGIAVQDIPNNSYGRVQVNGFVNSILLSNLGTSATINQLDPLTLVTGVNGMGYSAAPTYANSGFRYALVSNPPAVLSIAGLYASGLIKAIG